MKSPKPTILLLFLTIMIFCAALIQQKSAAAENSETTAKRNSTVKMRDSLVIDTFTATPNVAIPDNAYNGTIGSMACSTIDTTSLPTGRLINDVNVQIAMSHTFVGDLTIKLTSPSGSVLPIVSRPGAVETADDGTDAAGFGENSNLAIANPLTYSDAATTSAEQMGKVPIDLNTIQTICLDGGTPCQYTPARGAAAGLNNFAGFDNQNARGIWQLCIGDSAASDIGTFSSWTLTLDTGVTTAANASINGKVLTSKGQGIGNATLVLTGGSLTQPRIVKTNSFGSYSISDLPVGETYILTIESKKYSFANPTRVISLQNSLENEDFTGDQ